MEADICCLVPKGGGRGKWTTSTNIPAKNFLPSSSHPHHAPLAPLIFLLSSLRQKKQHLIHAQYMFVLVYPTVSWKSRIESRMVGKNRFFQLSEFLFKDF